MSELMEFNSKKKDGIKDKQACQFIIFTEKKVLVITFTFFHYRTAQLWMQISGVL